ncbi:MAG TPA: SRPBCC family protein [Steroidobacteraceae bacterium]|nr:SRPBCC family protein [Steroidobacteraceae bacterium]
MSPLTHEFTATLRAPRDRVFRALTDETELRRWFAEHAHIEPRAGGDYRFWGIHTYGAPSRADATQRVLRLEAPNLLAFSWTLEERESEVTLELGAAADSAPSDAQAADSSATDASTTHASATDASATDASAADASATVLKGRHHFPVAPDVPRPLDLLDDLWRLALANLRAHLEGAPVFLQDFSAPAARLRHTVLIERPRDRVFQALLDPAVLDPWLGAQSVVEPHVGGRYSYGWKYDVRGQQVSGGPTKILELVEDTKLVTDWPNWRGDPQLPAQRVTWLFESVGEKTRVTLIHEPFERVVDVSDYPHGWADFLSALKLRLEAAS